MLQTATKAELTNAVSFQRSVYHIIDNREMSDTAQNMTGHRDITQTHLCFCDESQNRTGENCQNRLIEFS